jgi:hypothetical protein
MVVDVAETAVALILEIVGVTVPPPPPLEVEPPEAVKLAETLTLLRTFVSVLGLVVELSLQLVNWYPVAGTAVTAEPLPPLLTVWVKVPVSEPCALAVYVRV